MLCGHLVVYVTALPGNSQNVGDKRGMERSHLLTYIVGRQEEGEETLGAKHVGGRCPAGDCF